MSLHAQIWSWAQQLKPWQSDLVRRLCASTTLTDEEFDEVGRILLAAYGALTPDQTAPVPQLVQEENIPRSAASTGSTRLLSLYSLENIGAVEPRQRIDFELRGLTVLYGDNGAGKSTYARVLKEACRASDRSIKILPNVYAPPTSNHSTQGNAKIDIDEAGATRTIDRATNTAPTPELSSLSVFDSGCAHTYSTSPSTIAYTPQALTLFKRLAESQNKLSTLVQERIDKLLATRPQFNEIAAGTKTKQWLDSLSEKISREQAISFAALSAEDISTLNHLQSSLQLAVIEDPRRAAVQLRRKAAEGKKLKLRLENLYSSISDEHALRLKEAQREFLEAQAAAELLSKNVPTGAVELHLGPAWKGLWAAVNAYCEAATTDGMHSATADQLSHCPLCLQPLNGETRKRFQQFQELATGHLEKEVIKCRTSLDERVMWLKSLPAPSEGANSADQLLLAEIHELEAAIASFMSSFAARRGAIDQAYKSNDWQSLPSLQMPPSGEIENWILATELRAAELDSLIQPEKRLQAEAQLKELKAKSQLSERLPDLLLLLDNIQQVAKLKKVQSALATKGITTTQSKLTENVFTEELRKLLSDEISNLGLSHLQIKMGSRGVTGRTVVDLQLNTPSGHKLHEVLSEGEQRALTLAFFLAEVNAGAHDGGIIFDDPVSSLDHQRRDLVASRLVREASKRQVIVFTHDIVFLHALWQHAEQQGIRCKEQVIRRSSNRIGVAETDVPWKAMTCKKRQSYLRDKLPNLKKLEKQGTEEYTEAAKNFLGYLRSSWEKAIEEKMLGGVIQRFNPEIHTKQLRAVCVTPQLIDTVNEGMTMCSKWVHDQAAALNGPVPTVVELDAQLTKFREFLESFKDT